MVKEKNESCCKGTSAGAGAGGGAVYGFGLFGALFYYLQAANSFGAVIFGILKSFVWPAMLVYHLFGFLHL